MSGDYSRNSFDHLRDFNSVLMQQGRVQLDSDWNEFVDILLRRARAQTIDTIGRAIVPRETIDGFKISFDGTDLTIGAGRIYVDGLLAENHGKKEHSFDAVLDELSSKEVIDYDEQPYLPNVSDVSPLPTSGGPHLVYLDVWQREITYLIDPDLLEEAIGVDTTTRRQTVWQVKVLENVGSGVTCSSKDSELNGWEAILESSAGRLSTGEVTNGDDEPCLMPPESGYQGLENQLYRVEIHKGEGIGTANFKFSRDNATVATAVLTMPALDELVVESTGRDSYQRFNPGDWLEIKDDWLEFAGKPGRMVKVKSVNESTRTITLHSSLPANLFPTDPDSKLDPDRHTRLIRWDQRGVIRDTSDNEITDLDATNSDGLIPVPPLGTTLVLENGVTVSFTLKPSSGEFHVGDYWNFTARTISGTVQELLEAPPLGVHHHYARLALVTFPSTETDCREFWPPELAQQGCACTVCVSADSHNRGEQTIQWAIDQVKEDGGTVCLGPGVYLLGGNPINLDGAHSVTIKGQGWKTILLNAGEGSAMLIQNCIGVSIEDLSLITSGSTKQVAADVALRNCVGATIEGCYFMQVGKSEFYRPTIGLVGILIATHIRNNMIYSYAGVANIATGAVTLDLKSLAHETHVSPVITAELYIENNTMFCEKRGISLDGFSLHIAETEISGNTVIGCEQGAIVSRGWVWPGSGVDVRRNQIHCKGVGMAIGSDGARLVENDLIPASPKSGDDGIRLVPGIDPNRANQVQVLGNRITGLGGNGIRIEAKLRSGMIKDNVIEKVAKGGIIMGERASAESLSIENNHLLNLAPQANDPNEAVVGIRIVQGKQVDIVGNVVNGVGKSAIQSLARVGIQILAASSGRISGNEIAEIGPVKFVNFSAGIEISGSHENIEIADNVVRRFLEDPSMADDSNWYGLLIWQGFRGTFGVVLDTIAGLSNNPSGNPEVAKSKDFYYSMGDRVNYIMTGNKIFGLFGDKVTEIKRGKEIVAVRGNLFEAIGEVPAVLASGQGSFVFNDNRCVQRSAKALEGGNGPRVVHIAGGAVVINANYMAGSSEGVSLQVTTTEAEAFTVLGNIATGSILVNGAALDAPWKALNVLGV